MKADGTLILVTLASYHLVLLLTGLWASRRMSGTGDYWIGGRAVGGWVAGLSYAATSSSVWVLLGFSGFVFSVGLSALWMLPGIWGGYIIVWLVFGPKLRRDAAAHGHVTLTDFLLADTPPKQRVRLALIASMMILFCFIFYIAAQLQAAGTAMQGYFGLPVDYAIVISALIIGIYALLGGFWAISLTDMIQGMVMALVAFLTAGAALIAIGGPVDLWHSLAVQAPGHLDAFGGRSGLVALGAALGAAAIGLGTFGQPQLFVRVMAVSSETERRKAFLCAFSWSVAVFSCMAIVGLAGRALAFAPENPETLLLTAIDGLLPSVFAGLALAALLSAVMSTVDSILLASAAAISHDMRLAQRTPRHALLIARLVMGLLTGLAIWLAIAAPATIFERVLFAWTALGAAFGPIVVARIAGWATPPLALTLAMSIGFALAVGFNQFWPGGPGGLYERLLPWIPPLIILFVAQTTDS